MLDGSWEHSFAIYLDSIGIKWERNKKRFIYNNENNNNSYYTPDFFLIDENIFIEVKGYETAKDRCKWRDFPHRLKVIRKEQIDQIKKEIFNIKNFLKEK